MILGGALLIAPGFLTDILGVLFLLPPTRAVARRLLTRFTVGRVSVVGFPVGGAMGGFGSRPGPGGRGRPKPSYDYDVEGEEVRADDPGEPRLPRGES